jgi:hypothetical protein
MSSTATKSNARQRRLAPHYRSRKCSLFGSDDYTILAPSPSSFLLTDENLTVASRLFGDSFDRKLRSFVIVAWLPALICQLASFPIGLLTLIHRLPKDVAILTSIGGIFPVLLLLRSHWKVFWTLLMKWNVLFLTLYSLIFCVCVTFLMEFDVRIIFVWMVILPALLGTFNGCLYLIC